MSAVLPYRAAGSDWTAPQVQPHDERRYRVWSWIGLAIVGVCCAASAGVGLVGSLALLTAIGFAGVAVGVVLPRVGLLALAGLCALDALTRVFLMSGGLLRWNTFNYLLCGIVLLLLPLMLRQCELPTRLLQILFCILTVEVAVSPDKVRGVLHLLTVAPAFAIVGLVRRGAKDEQIWPLAGLVIGALGALGGLMFFVYRLSVDHIDENALSHFYLTSIYCICLGTHVAAQRRQNIAWLGALFAANAAWVFLTGSRGGMLVALCCGVFMLSCIRSWPKRIWVATIGCVVALLVVTQFEELQARALHRIRKMANSELSMTSRTNGRYELALAAWGIFQRHPLGVGTGGFAKTRVSLRHLDGVFALWDDVEMDAHSAWTRTLAENGVPGILALAGFVGSFAFVGWRKRRQGLLGVGLLATAVLSVAFLSTEFRGKGLWFLAAAATVMLYPAPAAQPAPAPRPLPAPRPRRAP